MASQHTMIQSVLKGVKVEAFGEGFKGAKWQHKHEHRLYNCGRAVISSSKTYMTMKKKGKRITAKLHEEEKSLTYISLYSRKKYFKTIVLEPDNLG